MVSLTLPPPSRPQLGKVFGEVQASERFFKLHRLAVSHHLIHVPVPKSATPLSFDVSPT